LIVALTSSRASEAYSELQSGRSESDNHHELTESVLQRAFEYWRSIDKEIGDRIAKGVEDGY
jgi:hypothetical protein